MALHQAGRETNVFMSKMRNSVVMKDASLVWLISHDPWNKPGQWNEIYDNEIPGEIENKVSLRGTQTKYLIFT